MAEVDHELSQQIAATANRLRLLQIDFADQSADARAQYLSEELSQALQPLRAEQRERFLAAIKDHFPTWDNQVWATAQAANAPSQSEDDRKAMDDPAFLVSRLTALSHKLAPQEKQALAAQLRDAGLTAPTSEGAWPAEAAAALSHKLGLAAGEAIDPDRALELLGLMAEMFSKIDQLAWKTWLAIAPNTPRATLPRPGEYQSNILKFLSGSDDVSRTQVAKDLERLRQLTAAMISATGAVGHKWGTRYAQQLSPEAIMTATAVSGWANKEAAYWKKYAQLAANLDADVIDHEIKQMAEAFVRSLMQGLR